MVGSNQGVNAVLVAYRSLQVILTGVVFGFGIYEVVQHLQNEFDGSYSYGRAVDTVVVLCLGLLQLLNCFIITSTIASLWARPIITMIFDFAFIILWGWRGAVDTFFSNDVCHNGSANGIPQLIVENLCTIGQICGWIEVVMAILYLLGFFILVWKCFTPVVMAYGWRGLFRKQPYHIGALAVKVPLPNFRNSEITLGNLEQSLPNSQFLPNKLDVSIYSTEVAVPLRAAL